MTDAFFIQSKDRGFINIEGDDKEDFLQKLITQDMKLLKSQNAIYACLLTPQGKFLHDFFISKTPGGFVIECEGGDRGHDLFDRLNRYKLRSKITLSYEKYAPVYMVFGTTPFPGFQDPRHEGLGWRCYNKPLDITEEPYEIWDRLRIRLGVPDCTTDAEIEKSTLAELHIEKFNGVSYEKGCYVGQELTARMKSRGLAKKHLYAVEGSDLPNEGELLIIHEKEVGIMRSRQNDIGMALVKDAYKELLNDSSIRLLG